MTPLRQRMIEDMQVLNLAPLTQSTYLLQVTLFARHFGKSPEQLTFEHVREYQVHLIRQKKLAPSSVVVAVSALRFLYRRTLHKDWNFDQVIPAPQQCDRLPVILSPEEVAEFLGCVQHLRHRTVLTVCYAAGLRISEAVHLKVSDIDSSRMVLRVEQGKGLKDRYVMLSPKLLDVLRHWFRQSRPGHWLFPGRDDQHLSVHSVQMANLGRTIAGEHAFPCSAGVTNGFNTLTLRISLAVSSNPFLAHRRGNSHRPSLPHSAPRR